MVRELRYHLEELSWKCSTNIRSFIYAKTGVEMTKHVCHRIVWALYTLLWTYRPTKRRKFMYLKTIMETVTSVNVIVYYNFATKIRCVRPKCMRFAVIWVLFPIRMKPGETDNHIILSPTASTIVWLHSLDYLMGELQLWVVWRTTYRLSITARNWKLRTYMPSTLSFASFRPLSVHSHHYSHVIANSYSPVFMRYFHKMNS
jgi:hypothetical protein